MGDDSGNQMLEWIAHFVESAPYAAWLTFTLILVLIIVVVVNGIIMPYRKTRHCPHCGKMYKEKSTDE